MKHFYKKSTQKIHAFEEDSSQDHLITDDMIELTSSRPSPFHTPVIEDWVHTGEWELDEQAERQSKIPSSISRRQGRLALLQAGYLTQVEDAIEAITDPTEKKAAQIEYESDTWAADSQFLQDIWINEIEGTQEELEDLLISAKDL